ncbi:MAG: BON domain-containing protein [Acidobacteriota bacterium]
MFRALLRLIIVVVIVAAAIAFFTGYRFAGGHVRGPAAGTPAVGTSGRSQGAIDTGRARERGAEVGEKVAEAGNRAAEVLSDAALTTKIKSKMALDDTVKALDINVTTKDGDVTLSGYVHSQKERERALALARETNGVRRVTDQLKVR